MKLDQAASGVSIQFDLERVSARYTGQDIATMIAASSPPARPPPPRSRV
jgi:hypothetical protein